MGVPDLGDRAAKQQLEHDPREDDEDRTEKERAGPGVADHRAVGFGGHGGAVLGRGQHLDKAIAQANGIALHALDEPGHAGHALLGHGFAREFGD